MSENDEKAAVKMMKDNLKKKIQYLADANQKVPCVHCGMLEILTVELYRLEHPYEKLFTRKVLAALVLIVITGTATAIKYWPSNAERTADPIAQAASTKP